MNHHLAARGGQHRPRKRFDEAHIAGQRIGARLLHFPDDEDPLALVRADGHRDLWTHEESVLDQPAFQIGLHLTQRHTARVNPSEQRIGERPVGLRGKPSRPFRPSPCASSSTSWRSPTPAGEALAQQARQVLLGASDLRDMAQQYSDPFRGTLCLGVIPTVGPCLGRTPAVRGLATICHAGACGVGPHPGDNPAACEEFPSAAHLRTILNRRD